MIDSKFRKYFNEALHKDLKRFDEKRNKIILVLIIVFLLGSAMFYYACTKSVLLASILVLMIDAMVFLGFYKHLQRHCRNFRSLLLNHFININDMELVYEPDEFVNVSSFKRSLLFTEDIVFFKGSNRISGNYGQDAFEMSNLLVHKRSSNNQKLEILFEGLFLKIHYSSIKQGKIIIIPKALQRLHIKGIRFFNKTNGHHIHLSRDEKFDEKFVIYHSDDASPDELLNPSMIDFLINLFDLYQGKIMVSQIEDHFCLALSEPSKHYNAKWIGSNIHPDQIHQYYVKFEETLQIIWPVINR